MANDRVIKTDGDLDITASDTSVSGTLTVAGQATLAGLAYPTSDGTADQALVTNGSGVLSFADVASGGGGGVDTITSASEAASYSGTNRIIYITATEDVTFTTDLVGRIIIVDGSLTTTDVTVQNCDMLNCTFASRGDLHIDNTQTDGSDIAVRFNTIRTNTLQLSCSGNTSGSTNLFYDNEVNCIDFTINTVSNPVIFVVRCKIFAFSNFSAGTSTVDEIKLSKCSIHTDNFYGYYNLSSSHDNDITVKDGANSTLSLKINSVSYINSTYAYPFKVTQSSVNTKVIVAAKNSSGQGLSGTDKIDFDEEQIDNTASWSTDTFTAKVKGEYRISAYCGIHNVSSRPDLGVYVNGSVVYNYHGAYSDSSNFYIMHLNAVVSVGVGDTIDIRSESTDTSYGTLSGALYTLTNIGIEKIN